MIIFTGDGSLTGGYFNLGYGLGSRMAKDENPLAHIHKATGDIWVGNCEGVVSSSSCNEVNAGMSLGFILTLYQQTGCFICSGLSTIMRCCMARRLIFTSQGGFMDFYTPEFNKLLGNKFYIADFPRK